MGTSIFRGLIYAVAVSVLTLAVAAGIAWFGVGDQYMSPVIDVGLVISCLAAGYGGAFVSNRVAPGVVSALVYVAVVVGLLSFFYQILLFGTLKVVTGALLLAVVSALIGKGRAVYRAESETARPYYDRGSYGERPAAARSLSSVSVEHSEPEESGTRVRKGLFDLPDYAVSSERSGSLRRSGSWDRPGSLNRSDSQDRSSSLSRSDSRNQSHLYGRSGLRSRAGLSGPVRWFDRLRQSGGKSSVGRKDVSRSMRRS